MVNIRTKHLIHCAAFAFVVILAIRCTANVKGNEYDESVYSWPIKIILRFLAVTPLLHLSLALTTSLGLLLFDCFPDDVELKANLDKLPSICFRIVTKGNYPKLILRNLRINMKAIQNVKLKNFKYEIVTEKHIEDLHKDGIPQVSEVFVPSDYRTKKGALFKARNLQYCLEDGVNTLNDHDWIVHLDEDTVLTENAIKGTANFIMKNEHCFGHGIVDSQAFGFLPEVMNIGTFYEYGDLRFHSHLNTRPHSAIFRTVFLVARVDAEKDVSFDVEAGPSLLEDFAFGILMRRKMYTYGFVEGNVIEQAPHTPRDAILSKIRCVKGLLSIVLRSTYFSVFDIMFTIFVINIFGFIFSFPALICGVFFPVNVPQSILIVNGFIIGVAFYQQVFTVIKNPHGSVREYIFHIIAGIIVGPLVLLVCSSYVVLKTITSINDISYYDTPKRNKFV